MKNLLITCLTALAAITAWAEAARPLVADTIPTATGSNAIARLKADGQFDSLQAALTAARYGAKADAASGDVFAANPSHGFSSRFSPTGLRLTARTGDGTNAVRYTSEWRLEAVGYGETLTGVPRGEVVAAGQRVELRRKVPAVVEWFENRPGGLEHGFTLAERPAVNSDGQALRVRLAVDGDLQPVVEAGGRKLALRNAAGATVMTYDKLKAWDATGRQVTAVMEAQPGQVSLTVLDAEATYPLTIDPTFQQATYFKPPTSVIEQQFGSSVAISGDTLVVGSPKDGIGGAAYVFSRDPSTGVWTPQGRLTAFNEDAADSFGYAVAISGDTIVVGSVFEDSGTRSNPQNNSFQSAGAAYVFVRSGTNWTHQSYLKARYPRAGDSFGYSVGVSGDTISVGTPFESSSSRGIYYNGEEIPDSGSGQSGAVYVFTRTGTNWTQYAFIKSSALQGGGRFGGAVSVAGDTIVAGAKELQDLSDGVAFVYERNGTTWSEKAKLRAANVNNNDFGRSVCVSGDTIVIGAPENTGSGAGVNPPVNTGMLNAGAVYVFAKSGNNWLQQAYLKATLPYTNSLFGASVAISSNRIVVGSPNGTNQVHVFTRKGTNWTAVPFVKPTSIEAGDSYGSAVALDGEFMALGLPLEDGNGVGVNPPVNESSSNSGAAYVVRVPKGMIGIELSSANSLTNGAGSIVFSVGGLSQKTVTLTNAGTGPLTGINVSLSGPNASDFVLGTNSLPSTLAAGAVATFSVSFVSSSGGARLAQLTVVADEADENPFNVSLLGIGLGSTSFTNSTALTIPSLGNASVYPSTITVSNITSPVTDIRVRFTGFAHVGPDDVDALLVGPGGQVVGLMSDAGGGWTVTNLNLTFTDRATTLLPDNTEIFSSTNRPSNYPGTETLPPGATGTIGTNIMDLATNGVNGDWKLYIRDDSSSLAGGSLNAWSLTFELLPNAEIEVVAGTNLVDGVSVVDFGTLPAGSNSLTKTFAIQNLGATNLTGLQVMKGGAHSGDFVLGTNGLPASLSPGASASFTVTFMPGGGGSRSATAQILSSDADEGSFDIALVGSGLSALQVWRQANFGTTSGIGAAANSADPDLDGVTNAVEFAFGLNPNSNTSKQLPQSVVSNGNFVLSFTQPAGIGGVTYGAEWSPSSASAIWTPVADTGVLPVHLFSVPTNGNPTIFMRLKVSVSEP